MRHRHHRGAAQNRSGAARKAPAEHHGLGLRLPRQVDFTPESDLDLVVFAKPEQERRVSDLREAFEESNLPFRVDLFVWDEVPEQFRKQIEAEHVVLVEREELRVGSEWVHCTLGDTCSAINYGLTASASNDAAGPKFLRITDIVSGQLDWNTVPHVVADKDSIAKYRLYDGDIVIARTGASTGTSLYIKTPPRAVFASYLVRLQAKPDFNARFLAYYLKSKEFGEFIRGVLGDKSAQPNASASTMTAVPLSAPRDRTEQRTIAHILGTLDDKIELNRRMNQTLEEMARALFKSWFVDFDPVRAKATLKHHHTTLPQGGSDWSVERARAYLDSMDPNIAALFPDRFVDSELGPIPKGWEIVPLSEIMDYKEGPGIRNWQYTNSADGVQFINIRCIQSGDLLLSTANRIKAEEANGKYGHFHLKEWDIVVSTSGTLGRSAVVRRAHLPLLLNTSVIRFRPVDGATSFSYLHSYVNSPVFLDELELLASGSVQRNFGPTHLKTMRVLRPPYNCIERHEDIAGSFLKQAITNRTYNDALSALRNALLSKLMSGELRVLHF